MCIWCVIDWWISGCFGLKHLPSLHHSPARNPFPQICSLREQDLHCLLRANRLGLLHHFYGHSSAIIKGSVFGASVEWDCFIYYSFSTNIWPHMRNDAFCPVANCATCCGTLLAFKRCRRRCTELMTSVWESRCVLTVAWSLVDPVRLAICLCVRLWWE